MKNISVRTKLFGGLSIIALSIGLAWWLYTQPSRVTPKELVEEAWEIVDRNYVDANFNQVDWKSLRSKYLNRDYANKEEAYAAIREMLKRLEDPYTHFMDPTEFRNMQIDTSGELTGVGIQLSQDEKTKQLLVVSPIEDTPAAQAGILAKDVITKIDGKSTEGLGVNEAVNFIRGPVNTTVTLTVLRNAQEKDYVLKRAKFEIHPVRFKTNYISRGQIGYIRLSQFSENAPNEMREAIKTLEGKKVVGYILDLRSNPGGLLHSPGWFHTEVEK